MCQLSNWVRTSPESHLRIIFLWFAWVSAPGVARTARIMKNSSIHMQRRIFMRNVISQIADPAQPAYQGVVRDHFPFNVNYWTLCVYMQLSRFSLRCLLKNIFVWTEVDFQKFFQHKIMYCDRLLLFLLYMLYESSRREPGWRFTAGVQSSDIDNCYDYVTIRAGQKCLFGYT